jgi:hypothetical protein
MDTTITENYLNRCWEDFSREQMKLMTDIKTGKEDKEEKKLQRELTLINTIMISLMRLRNLKKKETDRF